MVVRWEFFTIVVVYCGEGEKMELKNCRTNCNPETTLYKEEVNVILTVVRDVLRKLQRPTTTGSFLLVGQKDEEATVGDVIVEFDFDGGAVEERCADKSSSWVVNHMTATMSTVRTDEKGIIVCYPEAGFDEEVLLLKTSLGRFICSACIGEYPYCEVEIYLAVAKALAEMRKGDTVLREAYEELLDEEVRCFPGLRTIDEHVSGLFEGNRRTSNLETWKEWSKTHEPNLYFE